MSDVTAPGSRRLLRRVKLVMSGEGTAAQRLDALVEAIANELLCEVCTVYVLRAGEVLELFATQGLNRDAVHKTRLRVGEGLVGNIAANARPLNLQEAQCHSDFAYRPETGEEAFRSFLGVPIIRTGRVRGVLAVQNKVPRQYTEEEQEALEMIVLVLAELIASGELIGAGEQTRAEGNAILPTRLTGVRINSGIAMGEAVLHQNRVSIRQLFGDDPEAEKKRLSTALSAMHESLDALFAADELSGKGEHHDVLETYRLVARDAGWIKRLHEATASGLTAEAAVQNVHDDMHSRLTGAANPYLRERLHDFTDLANRLMAHLSGEHATSAFEELPDNVVLLARNMGPAELLDYEAHRIRALLLEEASANSHVAIVARALDIPVIGRIENLLSRIDPHDPVIVDAENSQVFVRPTEDIQQVVLRTITDREKQRRVHAAMRTQPPVTLDDKRVSLNLNAGLMIEVSQVEETGVDGIGLFRTEIPFMVRSELPSVAAQRALYSSILEQAKGRPVNFRTLDIGGDKQLPYLHGTTDQNPNMGWRAIRMALDRPLMLRHQLRALIQAADGRSLAIMFPMVAEVAELEAARAILDKELERERNRGGRLPAALSIGAMLEVPGLVWQLPALLKRVDFLSVGSNDLFQFLFAADRGNPLVAERYDVLSPGMLELLRKIVEDCYKEQVPLSLCGEMAGDPLEAMALIGLGFRTISMSPTQVGKVRAMVCSLDIGNLASYMNTLTGSPEHSLRSKLEFYARDHGVMI
ncbi:MAG: phosphoenolpyruvate--protein phosphotransferase [Rhodospirillaceae bacterium]|nr:phosphoenolpyruvate--protein phosphotransferase [Rhodospirillaceae bacterium]